ncbi:MAG: ParB/RepB/Spo0J family partition protein [Thermodesulfobacteriota bacterium]
MKEYMSGWASPKDPAHGSVMEHAGLAEIRVPLEGLDLETGPYCTSFGEGPDELRASILRIGLVNPPLLHETGSGGWDVVSGFRRLRVLRALGCETCLCRDLSNTPWSPLELLLLGLWDNLGTRSLNELERAMALSRLSALVPRGSLLGVYMPLLGLPSRPGLLDSYLALESAEPLVRQAVAGGRLSIRAFQDLQSWRPDDLIQAVRCIEKLNISFNKQIQFIDILSDLIEIENAGVREILASEPFCSVLSQAEANAPQAGNRLLDHLRRRRFPSLEQAERTFRGRLKRLALPFGIRVNHPPYFEDPSFRLEITFRNGKELRDQLSRLSGIQGLESLGPPWEEEGE